MIRLFQKRNDATKSELDEVKRVLRYLKGTSAQTRFAVGAGVYLANADFMRRYAGMQSFRQIAAEEQGHFYSDLNDLENSLRNRELGMAVGVGLYRIWLADLLEGRNEAAELLGEALAELSRKASWAPVPAGTN